MLEALLSAVDRELVRIKKGEAPYDQTVGNSSGFSFACSTGSTLFKGNSAVSHPQPAQLCALAARTSSSSVFAFAGVGLSEVEPTQRLSLFHHPSLAERLSPNTASKISDSAWGLSMPSELVENQQVRWSAEPADVEDRHPSAFKVCRPKACRLKPNGTLPLPLHVLATSVNITNQPTTVMPRLEIKRALSDSTSSPVHKRQKTSDSPSAIGTTSGYRGVSWHSQTCKWKAQIKVNGRDVNLGRHKEEFEAAKAYDRAAICARGVDCARLNFPLSEYTEELGYLASVPLQDLAAVLRGVEERLQQQTSRYHGVRLNKRTNKWEAYIRISGKHVHLGCYESEAAAARAFDQAAVVRHTLKAGSSISKLPLVTNFPSDSYKDLHDKLLQTDSCSQSSSDGESSPLSSQTSNLAHHLQNKYMINLLQRCLEEDDSAAPASPNSVCCKVQSQQTSSNTTSL